MGRLSDFSNDKVSEADIKDKYNTYKDMSKPQLEQTLFEEVAKQKRNGTFDYETLSKMVESLRGSLPENDYNNIKRILENLK